MFEARYVVVVLSLIVKTNCQMEGFIVGGKPAKINEFPYAAYISTSCKDLTGFWACGGAIINQGIIVTAAHCVHSCPDDRPVGKVSISVGSIMKNRGQVTQAQTYVCHEQFDKDDFAGYDIALIRTRERLRLNKQTSRVAIMRTPPVATEAQVAGWGYTDEVNLASPVNLMKMTQILWTKRQCENLYGYLQPSTFCATSGQINKYIAAGDSGSALVIKGYIQIGLVSFKLPDVSKSVIIYTNVSYFYNWIREKTEKIYCK